jgi:hypothetical protein
MSHKSCGFDPNILWHSGILGAADEAVLDTVHRKKKKKKILLFALLLASNVKNNSFSMKSISCSLFKYEILCHYYVQSTVWVEAFFRPKAVSRLYWETQRRWDWIEVGRPKARLRSKDLRLNTPVRSRFCRAQSVHCKKRLAVFPSPDRMFLTKLPLAGNNLIIPFQGEFGYWHPDWGLENG